MSDSPWANFAYAELRCKCGQCNSTGHEMDPAFMARLQRLRDAYGQPMQLASAYRCARHPSEVGKTAPGEHFDGRAVACVVVAPRPCTYCAWRYRWGSTGSAFIKKARRAFCT